MGKEARKKRYAAINHAAFGIEYNSALPCCSGSARAAPNRRSFMHCLKPG